MIPELKNRKKELIQKLRTANNLSEQNRIKLLLSDLDEKIYELSDKSIDKKNTSDIINSH